MDKLGVNRINKSIMFLVLILVAGLLIFLNYLKSDRFQPARGVSVHALVGYYSPFDLSIYAPDSTSSPQNVTCDTFVVTGGDAGVIKHFKDLVDLGNSVNHVDDYGHIVLNINRTEMSPEVWSSLQDTDRLHPKDFSLEIKPMSEIDAGYCDAFVKVLSRPI